MCTGGDDLGASRVAERGLALQDSLEQNRRRGGNLE